MKTFIYLITILFTVLIYSGCSAQTVDLNTTFTWTATGDDADSGTVSINEIWYGIDSLSVINMSGATRIVVNQEPLVAGSTESYTTLLPSLLSETQYFFAIRASDEKGNWSGLSNIAIKVTPDIIIPRAIINFNVGF